MRTKKREGRIRRQDIKFSIPSIIPALGYPFNVPPRTMDPDNT